MSPRGDLAVVIPARNESDRISATVKAAAGLPGVDLVVVVDDGSDDGTGAEAAVAGAVVTKRTRSHGKAAAMETGAETVRAIELAQDASGAPARHLLFLDADLAETAALAGPLAEPVRSGQADMTIAVFSDRVKLGGHGIVLGLSGAGIERLTGWRPAEPLNGQRCLTRAAYEAARPLAAGWGAETAMTIDLLRQGMRVTEVQVPLGHRATGRDLRSQLHRARQLTDIARALAVRQPWQHASSSPDEQVTALATAGPTDTGAAESAAAETGAAVTGLANAGPASTVSANSGQPGVA